MYLYLDTSQAYASVATWSPYEYLLSHPEAAEHLRAHHLLVRGALDDVEVGYWEAAKLVAALRRGREGAGHSGVDCAGPAAGTCESATTITAVGLKQMEQDQRYGDVRGGAAGSDPAHQTHGQLRFLDEKRKAAGCGDGQQLHHEQSDAGMLLLRVRRGGHDCFGGDSAEEALRLAFLAEAMMGHEGTCLDEAGGGDAGSSNASDRALRRLRACPLWQGD